MDAPPEPKPSVRVTIPSVANGGVAASDDRSNGSPPPSPALPEKAAGRSRRLPYVAAAATAFAASYATTYGTGGSALEAAAISIYDGLGRLGLSAVAGIVPARALGNLLTALAAMCVFGAAFRRNPGPVFLRGAVAGALALAGNAAWVAAAGDVRALPVMAAVVIVAAAWLFITGRAGGRRSESAGLRIAVGFGAATGIAGFALHGAEFSAMLGREATSAIGRLPTSTLFESTTPVLGLLAAGYLAIRGRRQDLPLLVAVVAAGLGLAALTSSATAPTPFTLPGFGALSLGLLFAVVFARAASAVRGPGDGAVLLAAFAMVLGAHAGTGARRGADQTPVRIEAARIVAQTATTLPRREQRGDVLLGVPESGDLRLRSALRLAGRDDLAFEFEDALSPPPKRLRVARYGAPMSGGFGAGLPPETQLAFDAIVDGAIRLDRPAPGAALASIKPEDEPTFVFSLPVGSDPGPDAHLFTVVLLVREEDGRVRARGVPLDASLTERREADGRASYGWRPSWRSDSHADTELRIERGDLGAPGSRTWWTVLVGAPHSGLCGTARPASKPANPRFAARFNRPTTCATPAAFDVPGL